MSEWRRVIGWENYYEVSNDGQIRKAHNGQLIGQWQNDQGYMLARLSRPRKIVRVHRVVAQAFIEQPKGCETINHKNHCRSDNRKGNLEWTTQSGNLRHMTENGRRVGFWKGKRSPNAKLVSEEVCEIKRLRDDGLSQSRIAEIVGCSKRTVQRILNGESYV